MNNFGRFLVILFLSINCCACFEREVTTELAPVSFGVAKERPSYVVKKGDTLFSIAWKFDKDQKALAYFNHIASDASLKVGQSISLVSQKTPLKIKPKFRTQSKKIKQASSKRPSRLKPKRKFKVYSSKKNKSLVSNNSPQWYWPAEGKIAETFSVGEHQKGINIEGNIGSSILASKKGVVAYSGSGLRGYGNLVILRHSDGFLSAYAFNRKILVKEGEKVKERQKIAEMGRSKGGIGRLHFEIRKKGRPIDPLKFLVRH